MGIALVLGLSACGTGAGEEDEQAVPPALEDRGGVAGDDDVATPLPTDPAPALEIDPLTGGTTSVALDPAFQQTLDRLGVTAAPVGRAELQGGTASFPVTGGQLSSRASATELRGQIEHEGSGLALRAADQQVVLSDLVLDPDEEVVSAAVEVAGRGTDERVPVFTLADEPGPLRFDEAAGTAVLEGADLQLSTRGADVVGQALSVDALSSSLEVGTARVSTPLPAS